ncbi:CDP-diacylglycerol--glycerol-3-phosphate 3-phosphatidyltransferase [Ptychographa xylographoides]|nr:CDP-diacylglycerol--glycerol-3-phosphate 3-phosphatidyltransferase [Ptychographa xylographoides]
MLVRRIASYGPKRSFLKQSQQSHIRQRQMSSATVGSSQPPTTHAAVLGTITTELDRLAPHIDIRADQIRIIESPSDFYETLKRKIQSAKKRIYLSTLYIGKSEHELVLSIRQALERNPKLKVSILTDALRGTRETPDPSCASLLSPLAADFPDQVELRMYHTPNLTGWRKRMIPKRINEGWGLQHMKLYGVDDEVILSGANLSSDYFTNRQDRYHVFSSKRVSDYFARIHHAMCSVSFILEPTKPSSSYELIWPETNAAPSPLQNPQEYLNSTTQLFKPLIAPSRPFEPSPHRNTTHNTILYPLLTLPHSLNNELPALQSLLAVPLPAGSTLLFTAGYFNPHPAITASLLASSANSISLMNHTTEQTHSSPSFATTVVTASPWANGFYGSKGVSGLLPPAYTLLSRRFLHAATKAAPGAIALREWRRGTVGTPDGWTYHAKGFWLTLQSQISSATEQRSSSGSPQTLCAGPAITVIGSSNYTVRSYSLDVEIGAIVVTSDQGLQARLRKEEEGLLKYSKQVTEDDLRGGERRVGVGVRLAMWIVRLVGGSL